MICRTRTLFLLDRLHLFHSLASFATHQSSSLRDEALEKRQKELMSRGLPKKTRISGVKQVICVGSAKGGVGKSTVAVNLAVSFSHVLAERLGRPGHVGLLDTDVYGPSVPRLMNLEDGSMPETTSDGRLIPLINYNIECMSMGFLMDSEKALAWRGLMVMQALGRLVKDVSWGSTGPHRRELDLLVIDLPPGTGDVHLSLLQMTTVSGAVIVTTPQQLAVDEARRAANMFKTMGVALLGVIENMSGHVCSACGHHDAVFGEGGGEHLAASISSPHLVSLPLLTQVREGGDGGKPVIIADPNSDISGLYKHAARLILEKLDTS